MALDVAKYKNDLRTAAESAKAALPAKAPDDPERKRRVAELQTKWSGLAAHEAELGRRLADGEPVADTLLTEIDALKTKVRAELATFGITV